VCALIRVKVDEKWQKKNWGTPPPKKKKKNFGEKSELSEMARTLIEKLIFKFFLKFFTFGIFPKFFEKRKKNEKSELSEMARTVIEKFIFEFFHPRNFSEIFRNSNFLFLLVPQEGGDRLAI
jgi:hypothetical protein